MNGPNSLGTLLIQRLDAVLGTPLASHGDLQSGLRADAVRQPGAPARIDPTEGEPRQDGERAALKHAESQSDQGAIKDAKLAALLAASARGRIVQQSATPSAPTSLGQGARAILALLAAFPEAPPLSGRQPLLHQSGLGQLAGTALPSASPAFASVRDLKAGAAGPAAAGVNSALAQMGSRLASANAAGLESRPSTSSPTAGQTTPLSGAAPLALGIDARGVQTLAQALHAAIETSGLFYESHLADLAFGKRPLNALQQEPQSQPFGQQANGSSAAAGTPPQATRVPESAGFFGAVLNDAADTATAKHAGQAAAADTTPATQHGMRTDTAAIVRQQLDVLTNQTIAWQGEAWSGTPMQWQIERREPADTAGVDAPASWATKIAVTLPRLGRVEATLNLVGNDIVMRLVAPDGETDIRDASSALRTHFHEAGLTLSHLVIDEDAARAADVSPAPNHDAT